MWKNRFPDYIEVLRLQLRKVQRWGESVIVLDQNVNDFRTKPDLDHRSKEMAEPAELLLRNSAVVNEVMEFDDIADNSLNSQLIVKNDRFIYRLLY